MSLGLTFEKLLLIGLIAVLLIGPDRLPMYAAQFGRLVRSLRDMASGAKDRMREEMGPDYDDIDWKKLDPRQYDPRRIVREALLEEKRNAGVEDEEKPVAPTVSAPKRESAYAQRQRLIREGKPAPFDLEAT